MIVIIGVVYTLSVGNFKQIKEERVKVTLGSLKEFLRSYPHEKSVEIICLDECSTCKLFVDAKKQEDEGLFEDFIDDSIEVYRYDFNLGLTEIKKRLYFNTQDVNEDVCFSYAIDSKGVGEQVLVRYKERVYDFTTYLGSTPIYETLQEAKEAKDKLIREVLN